MAPVPFYVVFVLFAAFASYRTFVHWQRAKRIRSVPRTLSSAIAGDEVEVAGTAEPLSAPVRMPMSGREALYGEWRIDKKIQSGKRSRWVRVADGTVGGPFLIRDSAGTVGIDPRTRDPYTALPVVYESSAGFGRDPPPEVRAVLDARGITHEDLFRANYPMRFVETAIAPGDALYAIGHADRMTSAGTAWMLRHTEEAPLLFSTKNETALARDHSRKAVLFGVGAALSILVVGGEILFGLAVP